MIKRLAGCFLFIILFLPSSGISQRTTPEMTVAKKFLNAKDVETAMSCFAEGFRIWFGKKEGDGVQGEEVASLFEWDFALNRRRLDQSCFEQPGRVTCQIREENDFSRLLDYPGWNHSLTFWIDNDYLIMSALYEPSKKQEDFDPYLNKALPWLKENKPEILNEIYPDGKVKKTAESARLWVEVLKEWRQATGLPEIPIN